MIHERKTKGIKKMAENPFDEFKKIEKMFEELMGGEDLMIGGTSRGISIQKAGDETKVDVHGDISEEELERLKKKYPNAEISVNGRMVEESSAVEVLDEEESERVSEEGPEECQEPIIEEEKEEELESEKLALKRFKEKQKEKQDSD
ncbi:hypothetical protein AKJ51_00910 [candidate division MSBL1 archaeon SCGC-AAA382A20]|uniref:Uncharacterized protein n=1 Tax=candidate division MSBL1 archaeon SCGC-AAA382A20 TaxID=1698280 RepID=A0A133VMF7_9EURY|nr:hypothetical protein AKJ51_00910 [candidate division MSBL1 archaeon SCGC-AAA382A20]